MQAQHLTAPTRVVPENPVHAWAAGYQAAKREPWQRLKARILDGCNLGSIFPWVLPACFIVTCFVLAILPASR